MANGWSPCQSAQTVPDIIGCSNHRIDWQPLKYEADNITIKGMSVQITARIICDDCGAFVSGKVETRSTYAKGAYWSAVDEAKKRNWMPLASGQYSARRHYCQVCAGRHIANKYAGKLKATAMDFNKYPRRAMRQSWIKCGFRKANSITPVQKATASTTGTERDNN
jgi:hypothetical protein